MASWSVLIRLHIRLLIRLLIRPIIYGRAHVAKQLYCLCSLEKPCGMNYRRRTEGRHSIIRGSNKIRARFSSKQLVGVDHWIQGTSKRHAGSLRGIVTAGVDTQVGQRWVRLFMLMRKLISSALMNAQVSADERRRWPLTHQMEVTVWKDGVINIAQHQFINNYWREIVAWPVKSLGKHLIF